MNIVFEAKYTSTDKNLTLTRVVFEFKDLANAFFGRGYLTLTRVVFELKGKI